MGTYPEFGCVPVPLNSGVPIEPTLCDGAARFKHHRLCSMLI